MPDKLLAKEATYQKVCKGLTKVINDAKKTAWPCFPILYGTYALENFKHSLVKIQKLKAFLFPTILNRPYDPNGVVKDVTT